jgi:hypothetical protein
VSASTGPASARHAAAPYITEWDGQPARFKCSADLLHLVVPVSSVRELPGNPQRGEVQAIKRSLIQFGQRKPLVVNVDPDTIERPRAERTGIAEAGNHTTLAALDDGWTHLAVSWESDNPAVAEAFALADNRTAALASFDLDALLSMTGPLEASDPDLLIAASFDPDAMAQLRAQADPSAPDPFAEWEGMPEFSSSNLKSAAHAVVHFKDDAAADAFFQLLGRPRTRTLWWPEYDGHIGSDTRAAYITDDPAG